MLSSRASRHSKDLILVLISQGLNVALSPSVWTLSLRAHLRTFPHLSALGNSVTCTINGKGNLVICLSLPTHRELLQPVEVATTTWILPSAGSIQE